MKVTIIYKQEIEVNSRFKEQDVTLRYHIGYFLNNRMLQNIDIFKFHGYESSNYWFYWIIKLLSVEFLADSGWLNTEAFVSKKSVN